MKYVGAKMTELWGSYLVNIHAEVLTVFLLSVIDAIGYFFCTPTIVLFLSADFGLDDLSASWWFALYGLVTTVMTFFAGIICNKTNPATLLIWGALLEGMGKALMAFSTSYAVSIFALVVLLPLGGSLGALVIFRLINRLVHPKALHAVNAVIYVLSNVTAIIAMNSMDSVRWVMQGHDFAFSPQRTMFIISFACELTMVLIGIIAQRTMRFGNKYIDEESGALVEGKFVHEDTMGKSMWTMIRETWRDINFRRLCLICLILTLGTKTPYRMMDVMLPKLMQRLYSDNHGIVHWGFVLSLNPFIIVTTTWPITKIIRARFKFSYMQLFVAGGLLTCFSIIPLTFDARSAGYWSWIFFMVFVSIAEIHWGFNIATFAAKLAPPDMEGIWLSLAQIAIVAAKFPSGIMGGILLQVYCPSAEQCNGEAPWRWVLLVAFFTPFGFLCAIALGWLKWTDEHMEGITGRKERKDAYGQGTGEYIGLDEDDDWGDDSDWEMRERLRPGRGYVTDEEVLYTDDIYTSKRRVRRDWETGEIREILPEDGRLLLEETARIDNTLFGEDAYLDESEKPRERDWDEFGIEPKHNMPELQSVSLE